MIGGGARDGGTEGEAGNIAEGCKAVKGKMSSTNFTWREIMILRVEMSRH